MPALDEFDGPLVELVEVVGRVRDLVGLESYNPALRVNGVEAV